MIKAAAMHLRAAGLAAVLIINANVRPRVWWAGSTGFPDRLAVLRPVPTVNIAHVRLNLRRLPQLFKCSTHGQLGQC